MDAHWRGWLWYRGGSSASRLLEMGGDSRLEEVQVLTETTSAYLLTWEAERYLDDRESNGTKV
jgi:hypothetical protein